MTNQDLQNVNDKRMRGKESINIFCFRETKKGVKDDPFALLPECVSVWIAEGQSCAPISPWVGQIFCFRHKVNPNK